MNILFYLPNAGCADVDCRDLDSGNPGIGGTEYIIQATVLHVIRSNINKSFDFIFAAQATDNLNPELNAIKVIDLNDCVRLYPDYIVFKYEPTEFEGIIDAVKGKDTKLIPWCHNFVKRSDLTILANCKKVARIVCVSEEQLHMYRDHKAFLKSSYVYNGMPILKEKQELPLYSSRPNEVTYIGSIVWFKGFHLLAQAWKKVVAAVPDAKLNVIGSGKLYDRRSMLGKYGIAEESYEKSFMPYITDDNGEIMPSVKFWGVLGAEKNAILKRTRVGVPNPSGISETFCITALEMQAMGCLVTTIDFGGFRNTVYAKTGLLFKNTDKLADCIIHLLRADNQHIEEFDDYLESNFAFEKVAKDWMRLFEGLESGNITTLRYNNSRKDNLMYLREINRKIKSILGYWLPTIDFYRSILRRVGLVKVY